MKSFYLIGLSCMKEDKITSTTVITIDARILYENTVTSKAQMPSMEELLGPISLAITENEYMPLYIFTIDLEFDFGQLKLHRKPSKY